MKDHFHDQYGALERENDDIYDALARSGFLECLDSGIEPRRSQMTSPRRKTMPTVAIAQGRRAPPWLFHPEQPLPRSRPSPASTSTRPHTPNGASTPAPIMAVFLEVLGFFLYWMWLRCRRGWRFTWS